MPLKRNKLERSALKWILVLGNARMLCGHLKRHKSGCFVGIRSATKADALWASEALLKKER